MENKKNKILVSATHLRTGIDIVYSDDMRELADAPVDILLTEHEWTDIANLPNRLERLAGKFACKEAIMKVLGRGIDRIELVDIEILHDRSGKPIVFLQGSALRYWRQIGFSQLEVSISHHRDYAVGMAVAMKLGSQSVGHEN
jgi:holo-[acyl-carrier protein] synthase